MAEPTDAEIESAWTEATGSSILPYPDDMRAFARAVLAKWGTPAVAEEPAGVVRYTSSLRAVVDWYGEPPELDALLYTTPQPTQAQAGAVPMTDEQIERAAKKIAECMDYPWGHMPTIGREEMRIHARAVLEAAHGIKGGQHGAE